MATCKLCVKIAQLIKSLHEKYVFQAKSKDIDSYVGGMTFEIPGGTPFWNFVHPPWSGASLL